MNENKSIVVLYETRKCCENELIDFCNQYIAEVSNYHLTYKLYDAYNKKNLAGFNLESTILYNPIGDITKLTACRTDYTIDGTSQKVKLSTG